jgi:3-oxoadipate enol-lactonase
VTELVLLGGLGTTRSIWEPLGLGSRVRALDLPGHGDAPLPDGPVSVAGIGSHILETVPGRFSFCGVSLGGMVGIWLAANAPDRIERLVLACTGARLGSREDYRARAALVRLEGTGVAVDGARERWFTPSFRTHARALRMLDELRAVPREGYAACCEAVGDADLREDLQRVSPPTLAVFARDDIVTTPEVVETLVTGLPNARRVDIPGAHLANVEEPDAFRAAVLSHFTEGVIA